jgi:regulatory protein
VLLPGSRKRCLPWPRSTRTPPSNAQGTSRRGTVKRPEAAQPADSSNEATALRARALQLLARREHSRQELARKLRPADPAAVLALLDELQERGWLSEQRLADELLHAAAGRFGARKVMQQLAQKGVSEEVVAQARIRARENELDSARTVWLKRFGKAPASLRERARQARFLEQRGFGRDVIRQVLGGDLEQ